MATGSYLSIITLNENGLNAPTKRQRLAEWLQKQNPYICCLQETRLKTRDTYRLKVKGWKKIFHANRDQKKAGVAILISDKIDFKTKAVKRDKDGQAAVPGVNDQDGYALVPRQLRAGARGQPQVIGALGARSPQLGAVDHEVTGVEIPFQLCPRLQRGEIRTGASFGIRDRENDLARGDAGQEALLLRGRAMLHQRRSHRADGHERQRRAGDIGLFEEDELLGGGVALAAILPGPADREPAVLAHLAHGAAEIVTAFGAAQLEAQLGRHQRVEIVAYTQAQRTLFGSEIYIHRRLGDIVFAIDWDMARRGIMARRLVTLDLQGALRFSPTP